MLPKIIKLCKSYKDDLFIIVVIVLVALIGFGLGRLSKIRENKPNIVIENLDANVVNSVANTGNLEQGGALVGSKNGSKYHFPWCSGAQRISEANKVWFSSKQEAEKAGYTPASNCKGL